MTPGTNPAQRDRARDFLLREAAAITQTADGLDDSFDAAVDLLATTPGKVFVMGVGTSATIARRLAHLLSVCGTAAAFLDATDAIHGAIGAVTPGDVLVLLSKWGESEELNRASELGRMRGSTVVAVTSRPGSAVASGADLVVVVDSSVGDPEGIVAMGSTLAVAAWGDALALALMTRRGHTWKEVLDAHPGGGVGAHAPELLRRAGDEEP